MQPSDDIPPWSAWTVPGGLALGLAFALFADAIVIAVASLAGANIAHAPPAVNIAASYVQDAAVVAAVLLLAVFMAHGRAADFGFRRVPVGLALAWFLIAGVGYYVFSFLYTVAFNPHARDKLPSGFGINHSTAALVATAVFVCAVAPIAEEFVFRGFVFGGLRRIRVSLGGEELGPWLAAVITGVLFGAAHAGGPDSGAQLVQLAVLGFVLCLLRWRTGSLYPGMVLHSANNAWALGVLEHWNALEVIGLMIGAAAVVGVVTGPLASAPLPSVAGSA